MAKGLLIALTGSWGSGCTIAAEYLKENYDFEVISVAGYIKDNYVAKLLSGSLKLDEDVGLSFYKQYRYEGFEGKDEPKELSYEDVRKKTAKIYEASYAGKKEILQHLGNAIREKYQPEYLIEKYQNRIDTLVNKGGAVVVDQIKNLGENFYLEGNFTNYFLVNINAPYNVRQGRLQKVPPEEFFRLDNIDSYKNPEHFSKRGNDDDEEFYFGQQVSECVDATDIVLQNESEEGKEKFEKDLREYTELLTGTFSRQPSPNEVYMTVANAGSLFSECMQRKVGAVIIKGDTIISNHYNDVPEKAEACWRTPRGKCNREYIKDLFEPSQYKKRKKPDNPKKSHETQAAFDKHLDLCRGLCAEAKAISRALSSGREKLTGAIIYTTLFPCQQCAKNIIDVGIGEVIYCEPYPYREAKTMLEEAGVDIKEFQGVKAKAYFKLFGSAGKSRGISRANRGGGC